jgi:hypothetical protein
MNDTRNQVEEALKHGLTFISIDTSVPGVVLPKKLRGERYVGLNLSWYFRGADMALEDDAIYVTLTFGGDPFRCVVPWAAVQHVEAKHTATGAQRAEQPKSHLRVVK